VGLIDDGVFGPIVLFGQGGTAVEVLADRALGLPPLNTVLAHDMIARTRVAKLLKGYRDVPAVDMAAIEGVLIRLADIAIDLPEVVELDINPLLADADGVIALDARVVVRVAGERDQNRLAIRPYPAELETTITIKDGQAFDIRPIRPEDAASLVAMSKRTSPEDLRLRFFSAMTSLPDWMAARLSQIDYDREIALVAIDRGGDFVGVMRLIRDPDNRRAEFAIIVRTDLKGHGLGHALMVEMLKLARAQSLRTVEGDVLRENTTMLHMVRDLGGTTAPVPAAQIVRVVFDLTAG